MSTATTETYEMSQNREPAELPEGRLILAHEFHPYGTLTWTMQILPDGTLREWEARTRIGEAGYPKVVGSTVTCYTDADKERRLLEYGVVQAMTESGLEYMAEHGSPALKEEIRRLRARRASDARATWERAQRPRAW